MTEGPPLYGRDPLLRSLLPRLTGLAFDERVRAAREFHGDLPVVLVTGRHGMGRSAVLRSLAEHYAGRLPLAYVRAVPPDPDLPPPAPAGPAGAPFAPDAPGGASPAVASTFVELLAEVVCGLGPELRRHFPVLVPGLFAVSAWEYDNAGQRDAACLRYARLLLACRLAAGDEARLRQSWATAVDQRLARVSGPRDQAAVTAAVVAEYAERHRPDAARAWYRERFPEQSAEGDAGALGDPLELLGEWFHQGGDYRHAAEQTLMAAFLHDVASSYGRLQRWNREPRPLVLLDDAHCAAGLTFLDLLLEHRAQPGRTDREELVVVATRLGDVLDEAPAAVRRTLPDLVKSTGWKRAGLEPSAGLLAVPLTPLSRDDILLLLVPRHRSRPLHPYLASAVHSLTGGHPAATTALCSAALRATEQGASVRPGDLLRLDAEDGRPVTEALLLRLLPDRRQRDRLTVLSLARDSTAAEALAAHLKLEGPDQLAANSAADYLEEQQWQPLTHPDAPLVGDPLLQTLLVHEARRSARPPDDDRSWQGIHRFLRAHHAQRGEDGEADALRHTLATGNAKLVVAALTEEFRSEQDEQAAAHWLTCLWYAATAPTPPTEPDGDWTDERLPVALGAHDGRYADLHEIERCVNRLLHALWQVSEPDTEPDRDLCKAVGEELAYLSPRHPTWHAVLGQAARTWPVAARKKQPFPVPGVPGAPGTPGIPGVPGAPGQ
ncbi:collagen-like protein [Streptomyces sp. TRM68367]|uniref:collagen-like triple helix repeat-containing protein n=1 Tax=Streptomyces sp. TRM68367 TaxID=2758415 RepID=UPI0021D38C64|nr:collagen-like protein [Streptomyces sp. TRM68367]